jgi:Zn-dependent protease with chaperone function
MYPLPLTPENLTLPKEKTYFNLLRLVAILLWIGITATCVGLPYALLIGLSIWLVNGLLVAHLRSEGVQVSAEQFPELYKTYREVLATFDLKAEPELYVIQSNGVLNAFATRHSGRDFVVIYSSILADYGYDSAEIKFLIGHEIGHIKAKHLLKRLLLAPAMILPWVPPAYSRACEASCDRYGALAAGDIDGAISAMMTLSAGKMPASKMSPPVFAQQHFRQRGFFVSWHELNSFYPTLSQRVSNLLAIKSGTFQPSPGRHPLAYFFTLFNLRNLLVIYVVIILAAIALPAFVKARERAQNLQHEQPEYADPNRPMPSEPLPIQPAPQ